MSNLAGVGLPVSLSPPSRLSVGKKPYLFVSLQSLFVVSSPFSRCMCANHYSYSLDFFFCANALTDVHPGWLLMRHQYKDLRDGVT